MLSSESHGVSEQNELSTSSRGAGHLEHGPLAPEMVEVRVFILHSELVMLRATSFLLPSVFTTVSTCFDLFRLVSTCSKSNGLRYYYLE